MSFFNFSSSAVCLVSSYIRERTQCVCIDNYLSDFLSVTSGVPQGSVLGPLLFSLFINDLPSVLKHTSYHMFADDVQLYLTIPIKDYASGISKFNEDLERVSQWSRLNNFQLNASKSQGILITLGHERPPEPTLSLGNDIIPFFSSVKNLGLLINTRLTWSEHVSNIIKTVYGSLGAHWRLSHYLSEKSFQDSVPISGVFHTLLSLLRTSYKFPLVT